MYEITEVDRAELEREDARRDHLPRRHICEDCGRVMPLFSVHDCPALRPDRPDR